MRVFGHVEMRETPVKEPDLLCILMATALMPVVASSQQVYNLVSVTAGDLADFWA